MAVTALLSRNTAHRHPGICGSYAVQVKMASRGKSQIGDGLHPVGTW